MKKLYEKIKKYINKHGLISEGDHILIGLSGGPDSVAMLRLLLQFQKVFDIKISAAHLNHSLRGKDSDKDEKFVRQMCKNLDIELSSLKVDVKSYSKEKKIGIEEASRILRYEYLNNVAEKIGANKIATAHTADDNLETIIINLVRGTGLRGISGIPVKRGKIIRPLLCLCKDDILSYLKVIKCDFRIDYTNTQNIFRRNLIRNKVIRILKNMNPNLPNTVLRFSELMRQYEDNFNFHYKQFQKLIMYLGNSIVLDISKEIDYFEIIIMHLLHQNIEEQFGIQPILGDLEKIVSLRNKEKGTLAELSNGLLAVRESNSIIIRKLGPDRFDGVRIHVGKTFEGEYFSFAVHLTARRKLPKKERFSELIDFRKIQNGLILRAWSAGDKFRPLGMKGAKKVSDLLTDEKISHSIRSKILVLCDGEEIIWVCGVRLSDKYKITKSTKEFLELKIRYNFELQQ